MRDDFKETEDVRKIDRAFEIVLLIMSIIAAAFFEYTSFSINRDFDSISGYHFLQTCFPACINCGFTMAFESNTLGESNLEDMGQISGLGMWYIRVEKLPL